MTLDQLMARFATGDACKAYLVEMRWAQRVSCPRCGNKRVHILSRPWTWQCKKCSPNGYRFSPLVGTIVENTNYPLRAWFQVIYLMCQSKKGISALQIHRTIGSGSYRTAWYMCHRIRAAMQSDEFQKLTGVVEVHETYLGGKAKNRHGGGIGGGKNMYEGGRGTAGKTIVIGAIARKGNVVASLIENTKEATMVGFVRSVVSEKVKLVATDEHENYKDLGLPHKSVNHSRKQYVHVNVHTSNIDSFWSLLKRGMVGTFYKVSKAYLPLYLNEFSFRYNARKDADIFDHVIAGV
ncbi:MAG: IS1595 family transposase [Acidobacteria bacterium]|nr:MAG: IS1595 family transposase [Acidobacteriota bacterium]